MPSIVFEEERFLSVVSFQNMLEKRKSLDQLYVGILLSIWFWRNFFSISRISDSLFLIDDATDTRCFSQVCHEDG